MGPAVGRLLRHELRLWRALWLWARRRRDGVPPGAVALSYDRDGRPVAITLLALSVLEVAAVELLVPWDTVRHVLTLLGIYGVVLVLALMADVAVRPHVLTARALRLRAGGWAEVTLPVAELGAVRRQIATTTGMTALADGVLALSTTGRTDVELDLLTPRELTVRGRTGTVGTVRFAADDPAAAVAALRQAYAGPDSLSAR